MPDLPSGTVTFLFTDIEGSTALWERDRQAMAVAVKRQIVLLDAALPAHGSLQDEGLPVRAIVERLGGVPPRWQETAAALAVPISHKWHNAMTPLLSRFLVPSLLSMSTRLQLRTTIRERPDDTTGTPESCGSNGRKEWSSSLSRVTSRDRPGAQQRHRKGPQLLGPIPARGGLYRGRNDSIGRATARAASLLALPRIGQWHRPNSPTVSGPRWFLEGLVRSSCALVTWYGDRMN
jgi:hypothetical protein